MAQKDKDPMIVGKQWIGWQNDKIRTGKKPKTPEPKVTLTSLGAQHKELVDSISCDIHETKKCNILKKEKLANEVMQRNAWLIKRYRNLMDFSRYQNTLQIDLLHTTI